MSQYRIIENVHGFIPQRHRWFGWDGLTAGEGWSELLIICATIAEARKAIDADFLRRRSLNSYTDGAEIEIYEPKF